MNRLRIGLLTVAVALGGMSVGLREVLAGTPCGPAAFTVDPALLFCNGECPKGEMCWPEGSAIPGKAGGVAYTCMCSSATAGPHLVTGRQCVFALFVLTNEVYPACVALRCPSDCLLPVYDRTAKQWVCACPAK